MVAQPGSVATCPASQPNVPDFSCGFQFHLSSGTRSSVLRVFRISWSNSPSIDWPIVMVASLVGNLVVTLERRNHRRTKGELSSEFLLNARFPAHCPISALRRL